MKIEIITKHAALNYGAMLQNYALNKVIKELGAEVETIDYVPEKSVNLSKKQKIINTVFGKFFSKEVKKAQKNFNEFLSEINLSNIKYTSVTELKVNPTIADLYLSGSDQIWNPLLCDDAYFLRFVPKNAIKASYASSLSVSTLPEAAKSLFTEYLNDYDYISVREKTAKSLLEQFVNNDINVNIDPTLLLDKESWQNIAKTYKHKKPYILCYVLYRPNWLNGWLKKLHKKTGKDIVVVTTDVFRNVYHNKMIRSAGPKEFLGLIDGADFVISSSFHGNALAIANNKPFYSVVNPDLPSRITDLLEAFSLTDRIINAESELTLKDLDYSSINIKLNNEKERAFAYLNQLINSPKKREKRILSSKSYKDISVVGDKCTNCTVCKEVCPISAISYKKDEMGFSYPVIDDTKCVSCGKCAKYCHVLNVISNTKDICKAYYGWNIDDKVRFESSSGGIFGAISDYVLSKKGLVISAYYDKNTKSVRHGDSDSIDFNKFKRSKYVESDIGDSLKKITNALKDNRLVLFCGTPCQCSGVRRTFGKNENLIICDFLCHGVPSPKIYSDMITNEERLLKQPIKEYKQRVKNYGWTQHGYQIEGEYGKLKQGVSRCNWFFNATMVDDLFLRKSCYTCDKSVMHEADITLGDFWGYSKLDSNLNDEKGISIILSNTVNGDKILEAIRDRIIINPLNKKYIEYAFKPKLNDKILNKSEERFNKYKTLGLNKFVKKYYGKRLLKNKLTFVLKKRKLKKRCKNV